MVIIMEELENTKVNITKRASIFWMHEAIAYLGLDRLGLSRPEKAIYRLVAKGALRPRKISGHFAFTKAELDRLIANGDERPKRGRPRKLINE